MRNLGFNPSVVIDVGAQVGTDALYQAFPFARHIMIEPVEEHKENLMKLASCLKNAEVVIAAAYSRSGETYLSLSDNFNYSNIIDDDSGGDYTSTRKIPCITIDDLCVDRQLNGPYLIKIDVDDKELEVLKGMTETLKYSECVIVETIFFGEGPNYFFTVVEFMKNHGFVIYDMVELVYRPLDLALWQVDTIFVKKNGQFRKFDTYGDEATMDKIHGQKNS